MSVEEGKNSGRSQDVLINWAKRSLSAGAQKFKCVPGRSPRSQCIVVLFTYVLHDTSRLESPCWCLYHRLESPGGISRSIKNLPSRFIAKISEIYWRSKGSRKYLVISKASVIIICEYRNTALAVVANTLHDYHGYLPKHRNTAVNFTTFHDLTRTGRLKLDVPGQTYTYIHPGTL